MPAIMPFTEPVWYKVRTHEAFDTTLAYRALGYINHGESAWGYLVFITHQGHTYAVKVFRCTALPPAGNTTFEYRAHYHRPQTEAERAYPWAEKPSKPSPDLDDDI